MGVFDGALSDDLVRRLSAVLRARLFEWWDTEGSGSLASAPHTDARWPRWAAA